HGLWRYPTLVGTRVLRKERAPYVLSLHGLLMPEARRRHALRKLVALALSERRAIRGAALILAGGLGEAEALRSFDPTVRSSVVPLAVDTNIFSPSRDSLLLSRHRREVLSVSRLHPIKRLVELVLAFGKVAPAHPNWDLR